MHMSYATHDTHAMTPGNLSRGAVAPHLSAQPLLGNDVVDQKGSSLGGIKEIVLDMQSGSIGYVVLSFSGRAGASEMLFAVPWKALTLDVKKKRFVLDADKDAVPLIRSQTMSSLARFESAVTVQLNGLQF